MMLLSPTHVNLNQSINSLPVYFCIPRYFSIFQRTPASLSISNEPTTNTIYILIQTGKSNQSYASTSPLGLIRLRAGQIPRYSVRLKSSLYPHPLSSHLLCIFLPGNSLSLSPPSLKIYVCASRVSFYRRRSRGKET